MWGAENAPGNVRRQGAESGCHPALDLPAALGLGLRGSGARSLDGAVRLWVLQRYAHVHGAGDCHHDAF